MSTGLKSKVEYFAASQLIKKLLIRLFFIKMKTFYRNGKQNSKWSISLTFKGFILDICRMKRLDYSYATALCFQVLSYAYPFIREDVIDNVKQVKIEIKYFNSLKKWKSFQRFCFVGNFEIQLFLFCFRAKTNYEVQEFPHILSFWFVHSFTLGFLNEDEESTHLQQNHRKHWLGAVDPVLSIHIHQKMF